MAVLYRNTRAGRVRFLQVLFWGAALGFLILTGFTLVSAENPQSWLAPAILTPFFVLFALGMEWYMRCYVTALGASAEGLHIETLATFGRSSGTVPWEDVSLGGSRRDRVNPEDGPIVDNSAEVLHVRGRSFLLIDTTADPFDSAALLRFLRPRPTALTK